MQYRRLLFVALTLVTTSLGACAKGAQFQGVGGGDGEGASGGGGDGGGGGGHPEGGSGAGSTGGSGTTTSSTTTTTTSGSGGGGAGGMGGSGGGGAGGGGACFGSPNACPSAEALPEVSGDEGGSASASGSTSKWLKVHVTETDSSIFASDLGYKVSLSSPAGMDYDLYVRQGPQDGNPDCNAAEKKGAPPGGAETVSDSWGDDQGLGGEDDSVWLCIEVRYVSGADCNAKWNLTVIGGP